MNEPESSASSNTRPSEEDALPMSRGLSLDGLGTRSDRKLETSPSTSELKQVKIVVRVEPAAPQSDSPKPVDEAPVGSPGFSRSNPPEGGTPNPQPIGNQKSPIENQVIPARMLNEFVYCQRLFYYEFVEGVFVENADTLRGAALHQRVDSGSGALPAAKRKSETNKAKSEEATTDGGQSTSPQPSPQPSPQGGEGEEQSETIHSRSV